MSNKILFISSEVHPLVKTGGLADVSGSLPASLQSLKQDLRLLLPAYRQVMEKMKNTRTVATLSLTGAQKPVRILEGKMPDSQVTVWLVDSPEHFDRAGGPYGGLDGHDWSDNAFRFAVFAEAAVALAMGRCQLNWTPDIVHCNDWQSGLVPALLSQETNRPATVFTIHNLAYQGLFPWETFAALKLPQTLWSHEAMEFHDMFSFIKGGLVFADQITTVSPSYAKEIRTPEFGYGLNGLLNHRVKQLTGILNGVDYNVWDPAHDPLIPYHYSNKNIGNKTRNKKSLQRHFGLEENPAIPLIGMVGRMVEQKGIDLVLATLPELFENPLQVVIVGSGEKRFEQSFTELAGHHPGQLGLHLGYDEQLAHRIEAGSDMFLMPSRFEPCGLNQIYSLRYGTVPIVRNTGGLADTVVHASKENRKDNTASGFIFQNATASEMAAAVQQALEMYSHPRLWRRIIKTGMDQDYSWQASAQQYLEVYQRASRKLSKHP